MKKREKSLNATLMYFGFIDIVSEHFEEERKKADSDSREFDFREKLEDLRTKVMDILGQKAEVTNLENLFETPLPKIPWSASFDPIIFKVSLPLSLQKISSSEGEPECVKAEEFRILYDGQIFIAAADCEMEKYESLSPRFRGPHITGIPDVRDKFVEMLEGVINKEKIKIVPPTMTHEPIVLARKRIKKQLPYLYLTTDSQASIKELMRRVYGLFERGISNFYGTCRISYEITKTTINLDENEEKLFKSLKNFLKSNWWNLAEKRRYFKNIKEMSLEILEGLSKYESGKNSLGKSLDGLKNYIRDNAIVSKFLNSIRYKEYVELEHLHYESLLKLVEFAKKETETYSLTSSTIVAAIAGAIIGGTIASIVFLL